MKILKNLTASDVPIKDIGQTVPASGQLLIDTSDYDKFQQSANTFALIVAGTLQVSDGTLYLPMRVGLALLQDNHVIINEFYSLTDDRSILVGNGSILNLNEVV